MSDDITIPPAALEAVFNMLYPYMDTGGDRQMGREVCEDACLAMLKAWPGMEYMMGDEAFPFHYIILPLPQENTNDVA